MERKKQRKVKGYMQHWYVDNKEKHLDNARVATK